MLPNKKLILTLVVLCLHTAVWSEEFQPMNIMFVVAYFPAPSQTYILNMITGLIDRGHNVSIFAFRKNDVEGQPDIQKYGLLDSVIYEQFPAKLPECDIVFCQNGKLGRKVAENIMLSDWLKDRKLVICLRGSDITSNVKNNPDLYNDLFIQADLFLPVCNYFKQRLVALGCDPNKVIVYHSAINCSRFFFKKRSD